jgi:hypothetical protein
MFRLSPDGQDVSRIATILESSPLKAFLRNTSRAELVT